jgi:pheromone shutdown protein TraB
MLEAKVGRLFIVGVIHVDKTSVERVRNTIHERHPSIVALELCEERLSALRSPPRQGLSLNRNLLFSLFEILERTVGKELGVSPGTEMLEASKAAEEVGARLELIDFPISMTASCMNNLPFMEKTRLFIDGLTTILSLMLPWRKTSTVLTSLDEVLTEFRDRYPTLYKCLVEDRNRHMAARLNSLLNSTTGSVVAVVGLGHLRWLNQELTRLETSVGTYSFEWTIGSS